MKKITQLVAAGALLVAMSANAQTLTQDWKYTTDIPAIGEARFGTGVGGKVYVNDKSKKTLYAKRNSRYIGRSGNGYCYRRCRQLDYPQRLGRCRCNENRNIMESHNQGIYINQHYSA